MNRLGEAELEELTMIINNTKREIDIILDQPQLSRQAQLRRTKRLIENLKVIRDIFETLAPISVFTQISLLNRYLREMQRAEKLCKLHWACDAWEHEEALRIERLKAARITISNLRTLEIAHNFDYNDSRYEKDHDDGWQRLIKMSKAKNPVDNDVTNTKEALDLSRTHPTELPEPNI